MKSRGEGFRPWIHGVAAVGLFAVVWTVASQATRGAVLPGIPEIIEGVVILIDRGYYFHDIAISVTRFILGWVLGAALAIPAGLFTGREARLLGPVLEYNFNAQRAVPVIALVPLVVYWWGLTEPGKIFLVAWGVFFPVWVNTHNGARSLNPNYVNAARSLGTRGTALWWRVYLPHVSESILAGLRVAIGVGLICVVASELVGSFETGFFSQGLGYRIQRSADLYRPAQMLACIFTFGVLGWAADRLFVRVARPLVVRLAGFDPQRSVLRAGRSAQS